MDNLRDERSVMSKYWTVISDKAVTNSKQQMTLDPQAAEIEKLEIPEIFSLLPELSGKDVLELGAGTGRFTRPIAKKAKSVLAVDFIEKFIKENENDNSDLNNIEFKQADVTKLQVPEKSFDVVYTNWLLMYLNDEEVRNLCRTLLKSLKDDGYLFIRESCFHKSGGIQGADFNPTHYRDPATYNSIFQYVSIPTEDGSGSFGFDVILSRSIQAYIKLKNNSNQICWLLQKSRRDSAQIKGYKTFQEFLDSQQYTRKSILQYEKVFGQYFVSTGGLETTQEFVKKLALKPGERVLDVGCGIGGSAFYMAKEYDVEVDGIDLSTNMVAIALEYANKLKDNRVQFEVGDATKRDFPAGSFDVIYSRDTILHIADKKALFERFLTWLRPGGRLFITDYCASDEEHSEAFKRYVAQRGYILLSPQKYGQVITDVGFVNVAAEDRTEHFIKILTIELERFEKIREEFILEFGQQGYDEIVTGWKNKLERCGWGDQRWGSFYAEKAK